MKTGSTTLTVQEAVARARSYLAMVFSNEQISEVRLEEVVFDRRDDAWLITLGLLRPSVSMRQGQIGAALGIGPLKRAYKVVKVPNDETEEPSIRIREPAGE